jgi:hypothetical protein
LTNLLRSPKITRMKFKSAFSMVLTLAPHASAGVTMSMRSIMRMEMFCRAEWKAR